MAHRMSPTSLVVSLVLALALVAAAPCALPARAQDAYVVGVSADLSGPGAGTYGPTVAATRSYVDHVNGRGGVNGRPIRLVIEDNRGDPARAATVARNLVTRSAAHPLVLSSLSSTYGATVAEAKRSNVPLYFAGGVCPKETFPPADALQFCSSGFASQLDSRASLSFIREAARGPVRLGLSAMAIPIARAEIDFAESLAGSLRMTVTGKEITPPPAKDYAPFAARLKAADPNWIYSWSPWAAQIGVFESLHQLGWKGRYLTWAHSQAEDELERLQDPDLYVIGANAFLRDEAPAHAEIRAVAHRTNLKYPLSQLAEGFIAGLVLEAVMKATPWPPSPGRVLAAMNRLKVDLKGLRGGPLEWTRENHFRTRQYYRVWRWDAGAVQVVQVQDWIGFDVRR